MLSTFVVHPYIFSYPNSRGSTLFASFQGSGILRLCQLLSLRLRTRTLTSICSKRFVRFAGTNWMMSTLMNWCITSVIKLHPTGILCSFTRRKLKHLPIWDPWLASEWKELDAHQKHEVFGVACSAPPDATELRSHWNCIIKLWNS
jgi:hypothetical protein